MDNINGIPRVPGSVDLRIGTTGNEKGSNILERIQKVVQEIIEFIKSLFSNDGSHSSNDGTGSKELVVHRPGMIESILIKSSEKIAAGSQEDQLVVHIYESVASLVPRQGKQAVQGLEVGAEALMGQVVQIYQGSKLDRHLTKLDDEGRSLLRSGVKKVVVLGLRFACPAARLIDKPINNALDRAAGDGLIAKAACRALVETCVVPEASNQLVSVLDDLSDKLTDKIMARGKDLVVESFKAKAWTIVLPLAGPVFGAGALILAGGKRQSRYELSARIAACAAMLCLASPFTVMAIIYGQRLGSHALALGLSFKKQYTLLSAERGDRSADENGKSKNQEISPLVTVLFNLVIIESEPASQADRQESGWLRSVADLLAPLVVTDAEPEILPSTTRVEEIVDEDVIQTRSNPDTFRVGLGRKSGSVKRPGVRIAAGLGSKNLFEEATKRSIPVGQKPNRFGLKDTRFQGSSPGSFMGKPSKREDN